LKSGATSPTFGIAGAEAGFAPSADKGREKYGDSMEANNSPAQIAFLI
jgi:hypothetical protein